MMKFRTAAFVLGALLSNTSYADSINVVTSRVSLAPLDSLDWGTAGDNLSLHPSPLSLNTVNGLGVVSSLPSGQGPFQIIVQCSAPGAAPGCVGGNFSPRDNILFSNFFQAGPLTLTFSSPIRGAGFQIEDEGLLPGNPFIATIRAFDGSTLLGTVTENGLTNSTADGSAIFVGALSDSVNITSLVITTSDRSGNLGALLVDKLYVNNTVATPEPSSLRLIVAISVLAGLGYLLKLRRFHGHES